MVMKYHHHAWSRHKHCIRQEQGESKRETTPFEATSDTHYSIDSIRIGNSGSGLRLRFEKVFENDRVDK